MPVMTMTAATSTTAIMTTASTQKCDPLNSTGASVELNKTPTTSKSEKYTFFSQGYFLVLSLGLPPVGQEFFQISQKP